jgi:hypothetical protein
MEKRSSDVAIVRLRRRAREAGVSIRVTRASKSRPERTYDLIEKTSGRLLYGSVALADIEQTLARIAEDRAGDALVLRQALADPSERSGRATERPSRRRPLVAPPPLRDSRADVSRSTGTRRWMSLSAAVLGLATLIVAMQQPAFQDPDPDGGVLDAHATPRNDLPTAPPSARAEPSLAPASSTPLPSGSVAPSVAPPPIRSQAPSVVAPTTASAAPRATIAARPGPTLAPAATSRATRPPAPASPAPTPSTPRPAPSAAPTPTVAPSPEPTAVPPTPVVTPSPEPEASDVLGLPRVVPSPGRLR